MASKVVPERPAEAGYKFFFPKSCVDEGANLKRALKLTFVRPTPLLLQPMKMELF
jgi:hypothetical protein